MMADASNNWKLGFFRVTAEIKYTKDEVYNIFWKYLTLIDFKQVATDKSIAKYLAYFDIWDENIEQWYRLENDKALKQQGFTITEISHSKNYKTCISKRVFEPLIKYPFNYEDTINTFFLKKPGYIGFELINKDILSKQRAAFGYVLANVTSKIVRGKGSNCWAYSLPINVYDCRTTMEFFAYNVKIISSKIEKCYEGDTVSRLQQLTVFLLAMNPMNFPTSNPLIPTLGETFQCKIGDICCYFEETASGPDTFNFYLVSPKIKCYGYWYLTQEQGANSITNSSWGKFTVQFLNNNETFNFTWCKFVINGLLLGTYLTNIGDNITVEQRMDNGEPGLISVLNLNNSVIANNSWFGEKTMPPDMTDGYIAKKEDWEFDQKKKIYSIKKGKECIGKYEGEWSEFLKYNGEYLWKKQDETQWSEITRMEFTLKSDSWYRDDGYLIKEGMMNEAMEAKIFIDERAKADKLWRSQYAN